ncbi:MAG TPA: hypothetical protein DFS52_32555, partial [Myxococcales bacterium]|nr:hypothetical protein [Myxococcales bacterium]
MRSCPPSLREGPLHVRSERKPARQLPERRELIHVDKRDNSPARPRFAGRKQGKSGLALAAGRDGGERVPSGRTRLGCARETRGLGARRPTLLSGASPSACDRKQRRSPTVRIEQGERMLGWLDAVMKQAGLAGLAALLLASGLEYVFPPFPGDSVTVFGGVYAMRAGIPVAAVFAVLMAGSLLGAMADWALGRWLGRKLAAAPHAKRYLRLLSREQILVWEERFRRRGTWWLLLNRFLPGVRAPIFLAAGASGICARRVLLWGGLSSLVWNALLFGVGCAVGGQA